MALQLRNGTFEDDDGKTLTNKNGSKKTDSNAGTSASIRATYTSIKSGWKFMEALAYSSRCITREKIDNADHIGIATDETTDSSVISQQVFNGR